MVEFSYSITKNDSRPGSTFKFLNNRQATILYNCVDLVEFNETVNHGQVNF